MPFAGPQHGIFCKTHTLSGSQHPSHGVQTSRAGTFLQAQQAKAQARLPLVSLLVTTLPPFVQSPFFLKQGWKSEVTPLCLPAPPAPWRVPWRRLLTREDAANVGDCILSLQHPFKGDLPLPYYFFLPLLGVPALDGSSKLWRHQGKSAFSHPLRGGKKYEVPNSPRSQVLGVELSGEGLAGYKELL